MKLNKVLKILTLISFINLLFTIGCGVIDSNAKYKTHANKNLPNVRNYVTEPYYNMEHNDPYIVNSDNTIRLYNYDIDMAINITNEARHEVGVYNDLVWDYKLANLARVYAITLSKNGKFEHDPNNLKYYTGENLFATSLYESSLLSKSIVNYYSEKSYYTYGNIGDSSTCKEGITCGHYTQLIWNNTSKVGCAAAQYQTGPYKGWYVTVCKYSLPGNIIGKKPY